MSVEQGASHPPQAALAWEVPIFKSPKPVSPIKTQLHERLLSSSSSNPHPQQQTSSSAILLSDNNSQQPDEDAARARRQLQLEERRKRSREIVERAKFIAAQHSRKLKEEIANLKEQLSRKQAEAALRRNRLRTNNNKISPNNVNNLETSSGLNNKVPIEPSTSNSTLVMNSELKSLKAQFRACQRLVCVVAKRKLHNAKAKLLAMRVRSVRQLQRQWRTLRTVRNIDQNVVLLDHFLHGLPSFEQQQTSFEQVFKFMETKRCKELVEILVPKLSPVNNNKVLVSTTKATEQEKQKLILLTQMIVRHPTEILSVSQRKQNVLVFASGRLLRLLNSLYLDLKAHPPASSNRYQGNATKHFTNFSQSLDGFQVLFEEIKRADADALIEEMFPTLVEMRVRFEESSTDSEEKKCFEKSFLNVLGKMKKLCGPLRQDKYKSLVSRCAREVKRKREDLNLVRRLAVEGAKNSVVEENASKSTSEKEKATTLERFQDLTDEEMTRTILDGLEDIRRRLKELTPNRRDLNTELDEYLDLELIQQQIRTKTFDFSIDFPKLVRFIAGRIELLSEKEQAKALNEWILANFTTNNNSVVFTTNSQRRIKVFKVFEKFFEQLSLIERDVAKFHMDNLRTVLQSNSSSTTSETLLEDHVRGRNFDKKSATLKWLSRYRSDGSSLAEIPLEESLVTDVFAKIISGLVRVSSLEGDRADDVFDEFEFSELRKLCVLEEKIFQKTLCEIVWKQVMLANHPHKYSDWIRQTNQGNEEYTKKDLHKIYFDRTERVLNPEQVPLQTGEMLQRLMTSTTNPMNNILRRRLYSVLIKVSSSSAPQQDSSVTLQGIGMTKEIQKSFSDLCAEFHRFVRVFCLARMEKAA